MGTLTLKPRVAIARPNTNVLKRAAMQAAPQHAAAISAIPPAVLASVAATTLQQSAAVSAPTAPETIGGQNYATTAVFAYDDQFNANAGMPLDNGPRRGLCPIKLIPGNLATGASGTTGNISCTPTKRVRPFRMLLASGQGTAVLVSSVSAVARTMGLDNSNSAPFDTFSEKCKNSGRVQVPDLDANSAIIVSFTGGANSTTYYALFFAYVLDETLNDPPFANAQYRGERWSFFGSTSISASSNSTLKTTPTEYFQPKRLTFDDNTANFWSAAGVGLLMKAGYPTIADRIEEVASADYPLIAHSTVAEDDVVDFDTIAPNTAFSAQIGNTNTSASITAQGHATGDMWE